MATRPRKTTHLGFDRLDERVVPATGFGAAFSPFGLGLATTAASGIFAPGAASQLSIGGTPGLVANQAQAAPAAFGFTTGTNPLLTGGGSFGQNFGLANTLGQNTLAVNRGFNQPFLGVNQFGQNFGLTNVGGQTLVPTNTAGFPNAQLGGQLGLSQGNLLGNQLNLARGNLVGTQFGFNQPAFPTTPFQTAFPSATTGGFGTSTVPGQSVRNFTAFAPSGPGLNLATGTRGAGVNSLFGNVTPSFNQGALFAGQPFGGGVQNLNRFSVLNPGTGTNPSFGTFPPGTGSFPQATIPASGLGFGTLPFFV